ncbi:amidohydrolase family protein [Thiosulfatihalobacter marinus]|uniref:amidohydrolase family protein n=1 Tax=Thiosulfatihalobacter marinus TaxID=2792481 RepID=UPI0022B59BAD|nr:amidohydrolase family protein [Thiosulfatihalobacter marinus]
MSSLFHSLGRTASAGIAAAALFASGAHAAEDLPTLFTNVNVFDGVNETMIENANVVVTGNLISAISTEPLAVAGATVIDGGGRTMIPGLIDVHWHVSYCCTAQSTVVTGDILEVAIRGAKGAEATLMRGFTSVRDVGGNPLPRKK